MLPTSATLTFLLAGTAEAFFAGAGVRAGVRANVQMNHPNVGEPFGDHPAFNPSRNPGGFGDNDMARRQMLHGLYSEAPGVNPAQPSNSYAPMGFGDNDWERVDKLHSLYSEAEGVSPGQQSYTYAPTGFGDNDWDRRAMLHNLGPQ